MIYLPVNFFWRDL